MIEKESSSKSSNNSNNLTKKERKSLMLKNFILDSAKQLFTKNSFNEVKMIQIAEQAALSRATLYNYFNTKEEIFFGIGLLKVEQMINEHKKFYHAETFGYDQILSLSKNLLKDLLEDSFYNKMIRRFFTRCKELNIPIENIFYESIVDHKIYKAKPKIDKKEKIFIKLLEKYIEYRQLWQKVLEKGVKDGSIKSSLNIYQLNFIIIMLIYGITEQVDLRRILLIQIELPDDNAIEITLELIKKLLRN